MAWYKRPASVVESSVPGEDAPFDVDGGNLHRQRYEPLSDSAYGGQDATMAAQPESRGGRAIRNLTQMMSKPTRLAFGGRSRSRMTSGGFTSDDTMMDQLHSESYDPFQVVDIHNPPPRKPRGTGAPSKLYRLWIWELLASIFSMACIASIIIVLYHEQDKPLDQWQQGIGKNISPTAVVSFLGTIGRSASLVALTEIISQLKWMHFASRPQVLSDIQLFDSASRGPWGSLMLLVSRHKRTLLASCASILVLVSLLMDPFVQLIFDFPNKLTPISSQPAPQILASQVYDPDFLQSRWQQCYGPFNVNSAMQASILAPVWNSTRAPSLPCDFQRCDWPNITTLGTCGQCKDLSGEVTSHCTTAMDPTPSIFCYYTLTSVGITLGATFNITGGAAEMTAYQTLWNSTGSVISLPEGDHVKPFPAQLSHFTYISLAENLNWTNLVDTGNPEKPVLKSNPPLKEAGQCQLSLCARTFTTPYYDHPTAGPLNGPQTPLDIKSVPSMESNQQYLPMGPVSEDHPAMNSTFSMNLCDYTDLTKYFYDLFSIEYLSEGMNGINSMTSNEATSSSVTPNIGPALSETKNMTALIQSIADSMTEAFRTSANSTSIQGIGSNTVTYIKIKWAWTALPVAVVMLTFLILTVVIIQNQIRGVPAWKSSSLALLFSEVEGWDTSSVRGGEGLEEMEKLAERTSARTAEGGQSVVFIRS